MDEERDTGHTEFGETTPSETTPSGPHASGWLVAAVVVLLVGLCVALGHSYVQSKVSGQRASEEAAMNATMSKMQNQIDALTTKLNALATAPAATVPAATVIRPAQPPAVNSAVARRRTAAEARRYKQLQAQLAEQQKQLKDTQDQLAQTRTDLEGNISSTRDELNGSIAKTHDELVTLEQKGERNYFEFDLTKSKQFAHAGPVMVSLRKADTKHKSYDVAMIVDDTQMSKKHVNLYEPIWIDGGDSQEMQLVVNKIDKDHVHGYVSAPKYNPSAGVTQGANGSASAGTAAGSNSNSNGNSSGSTQPTQ
jgi:uncharacterized coiled-coil protein SlyX